jgi:polar amino acid transport system substrate-binding protein
MPSRLSRAVHAGRHSFALAVLCLLTVAPLSAREAISLCYEGQDVLPWRTVNATGLNFDLLRQVANELHVTFNFVNAPWKRCLAEVKANKMAGAFAISYSPDRRDIGEYPGGAHIDSGKRMHVDRFVLIRKKGSPADWDGKQFHNIDGAIGFQLGYSVGAFLQTKNVRMEEGTNSPVQLVQKLIAGRVAAVAVGGGHAATLMRGPYAAEIEELPTPLIEKQYYLILSHAFVAANPQFANRIWATIEDVRNSAAYIKQQDAAGDLNHD